MDGLTCTRKIRELEAEGKLTGHVPIIAVTANARAEQVQTALDAGMVSTDHSPTSDHLQMRPVRWCLQVSRSLVTACMCFWHRLPTKEASEAEQHKHALATAVGLAVLAYNMRAKE